VWSIPAITATTSARAACGASRPSTRSRRAFPSSCRAMASRRARSAQPRRATSTCIRSSSNASARPCRTTMAIRGCRSSRSPTASRRIARSSPSTMRSVRWQAATCCATARTSTCTTSRTARSSTTSRAIPRSSSTSPAIPPIATCSSAAGHACDRCSTRTKSTRARSAGRPSSSRGTAGARRRCRAATSDSRRRRARVPSSIDVPTRRRTIMKAHRGIAAVIACMAALALALPALGQTKIPKVVPITVVINQSPWFASFAKAVDAYEKESGNKVNLDVNPFAGSAEKQRASVRAKEGQFDLLVMNSTWLAELYHGGFLTALNDIDPSFKLDPQVINFDDTAYWDAKNKRNSSKTGVVYGVPINANIGVLYYRADLYEKAGLKVPQTWDDVAANAAKLNSPPAVYGIVQRG